MPITVTIAGDDAFAEMLLLATSPEAVNAVLADVMSGARAFWIKQANEKLHSSRRDYVNGIQEVVVEDGIASITLTGALALMVENGASPFDMHQTLLGPSVPVAAGPGQPGKRVNKQGQFYRSIPFRHQTPGTIGQGGGVPMGTPYGSSAIGKAVHAAAKKLAPTTRMPGQGTQWGGRLESGLAPLLKPHHSVDIYAGMVKQKATGSGQNTYTTFRTISEAVPDKWLHPGMPPANLIGAVEDYVSDVLPAAIQQMIGEAID